MTMPHPDRRTFLTATAALATGGLAQATAAAPVEVPPEWRNKVEGMAYRQLGRTGMMISEVVCGGDPIKLDNYQHLELALRMGLNYLDMAPQYNSGQTEQAYGKLLAAVPQRRQTVFLATKVSGLTGLRNQLYRELFDKLPTDKQQALVKRAKELREARGVEKPGYFVTYYPGQPRAFEPCYLRVAMMPEYAEQIEISPRLRQHIRDSVDGSLRRVGTDHFDVLMCPHGADCPEDVKYPEVPGVFAELKKQGKVRFLGVTAHNDPAGVLRAATEAGHYDVVMCAYNAVNGGYLDDPIRQAATKGVGVIAMKVAHAIATHHKQLQPVPEWRVQMIDRIVPGDLKPPMKAYLWALQNPRIAAVISNLWDETYVKENVGLAGKRVELKPA
jgi:aryl-alcohol dehydrogenase-like predicted oxidoreductase